MSQYDDGLPHAVHIPLTDDGWTKVEHLFREEAKSKGGRPKADPRAILNAILWISTRRESWNHLPATFPPIQTCYIRSLKWKKSGLLAEAFALLGLAAPSSQEETRETNGVESRTGVHEHKR